MTNVVPIYAACLAVMFLGLSILVIRTRRSMRVSVGDGGNMSLLRRQRAHANFAEYVPLILLLMALAEQQNAAALLLHAVGAMLLTGRTVHAYALCREPEPARLRVAGMALTLAALLIAALANLVPAL